MADPKLFVSYSWTSPDHEAWVVQLASDLRESGVDVILDKWDLKEGHDANAFMEKMVTDPEVTKVILICDKAYADKTDGRSGGVGTEAQIISPKIYEKQDQDKFVAVVTERDEEGKAYLPAYYSARIYIDLSDQSTFAENFEQLLRWVYGQPLHKKPELGKKPAYLSEEEGAVRLATSARHRRAMDAITNNRDNAIPAVTEYFTALTAELEKLRLDPNSDPLDEAVIQSIESFLPYRNEAIEVFLSLALYRDTPESRTALHRFFEQLIPYLDRPQHVTQWKRWEFDNFRFVIHELFLYALACLIQHERFESAAYLMSNEFFVPGRSEYGQDVMVPFHIFDTGLVSLNHRNERLELRRLSLRADLLEQRCKGHGVQFRQIMQADFILFLRDHLHYADTNWNWQPDTLLYLGRHSGPLEVFARSRSASYFERASFLLGVDTKNALQPLLERFAQNPRAVPNWGGFDSFNPAAAIGFNEIATKP